MKSLNQEISTYVRSKSGSWASSTMSTAYSKLCTVASCGFKPDTLYEKLSKRGYSPYTIQTYFILASKYETEVKKTNLVQKWIEGNRLKFKNCYKTKTRSMTSEQFNGFLAKALDSNVYNFLVLMGKAGLRKGEAFSLQWEDVKADFIEVKSGKGGKQRIIPFNWKWLKPLTPTPTFPSASISKFFNEVCTEFTPHDFRSYYATKIVNIPGMSIEDARDLLGHNDIRTTVKYLRANKDKQSRLIMENF